MDIIYSGGCISVLMCKHMYDKTSIVCVYCTRMIDIVAINFDIIMYRSISSFPKYL